MMTNTLSSLVTQVQSILTNNNITEAIQSEIDVADILQKIRNGAVPVLSDKLKFGHLYEQISIPLTNEIKFSNVYENIFELNSLDTNCDMIRYDVNFKNVLDNIQNAPMWYELSDDDLEGSLLPPFRIASKSYYLARNIAALQVDAQNVTNLKMKNYEGTNDHTRDVFIRDDKSFKNGMSRTTNLSYISYRVQNEYDPYYITHPIEYLMVVSLIRKSINPKGYDYGLRYLQLMLTDMGIPNYSSYHLPIEFSSEGKLMAHQCAPVFSVQFRYILNLSANLVNHVNIHGWNEEFMDVSNEILLYVLPDPYKFGKDFKKSISNSLQYFGMDIKNSNDNDHLHPHYDIDDNTFTRYPAQFTSHDDCTGCQVTKLDRAVYTKHVRARLASELEDLARKGLHKTADFIKKYLHPRNASMNMVKYVIFLKLHIGAGGYSHSHQLTDFKSTLMDNIKFNDAYVDHFVKSTKILESVRTDGNVLSDGKNIDGFMTQQSELVPNLTNMQLFQRQSQLINEMELVGYKQTQNLIDKGAYPSRAQFRENLSSYLTAKSAGKAPIQMTINTDEGIFKTNLNSKAALTSIFGQGVFDTYDLLPLYDTKEELLADVRDDSLRQALLDDGLSARELSQMAVSRIGSRATSAFRAERPIYMNKMNAHILQCATVKPHVDATTHRYREAPKGIFINDHDYGTSILTTDQDGSDDAFAPLVMCTSAGKHLILCADCSQWDQRLSVLYMNGYYTGIGRALEERGEISGGTNSLGNDASNVDAQFSEFFMYADDGKSKSGLTLPECVELYKKIQSGSKYIATYHKSSIIFFVNFMSSGRLDTFHLNSVVNDRIFKTFFVDTVNLYLNTSNTEVVYAKFAGDDMASILKLENPSSEKIAKLAELTTVSYTGSGMVLNETKVVEASRFTEMAKRNGYFGMVFREPYIQMFEAEKTTKAENRLDVIRGVSQKQFEAFRRSFANARASTIMLRFFASLTYNFKYQLNAKYGDEVDVNARRKSYKFYPPYMAVVLPPAVAGGLGVTISGVSMSESLLIYLHLQNEADAAMAIADSMKFDAENLIMDSLLRKYIPKEKLPPQVRDSAALKINSLTLVDGGDTTKVLNINEGMLFKLATIPVARKHASLEAAKRLRVANISIDDTSLFPNSPYNDFYKVMTTIPKPEKFRRKDIRNNVLRNLKTENGEITLDDGLLMGKKFADLYHLYKIVSFNIQGGKCSPSDYKNQSVRYVTAPDTYHRAEMKYGARQGKHVPINLKGMNSAITKFISRAGLQYTEEQLSQMVSHSGILISSNRDALLRDFFLALSGSAPLTDELMKDLALVDYQWSDSLVGTTIAGTTLENLDLQLSNVKKRVSFSNVTFPLPIERMLTYVAFLYVVQFESFTANDVAFVSLGVTKQTLEELSKMESLDKKNRSVYGSIYTSLHEMYTKNKIDSDIRRNMLTSADD